MFVQGVSCMHLGPWINTVVSLDGETQLAWKICMLSANVVVIFGEDAGHA